MIEHNHKFTAADRIRTYKPNCPRCKLEDAAEELAEACKAQMKAWIQDKPRSLHDVKTDMDAAYAQAKAALTKAGVTI